MRQHRTRSLRAIRDRLAAAIRFNGRPQPKCLRSGRRRRYGPACRFGCCVTCSQSRSRSPALSNRRRFTHVFPTSFIPICGRPISLPMIGRSIWPTATASEQPHRVQVTTASLADIDSHRHGVLADGGTKSECWPRGFRPGCSLAVDRRDARRERSTEPGCRTAAADRRG